jgi:hypothetical protein
MKPLWQSLYDKSSFIGKGTMKEYTSFDRVAAALEHQAACQTFMDARGKIESDAV